MTTSSFAHSTPEHALRRRGSVLLGVAGGAALAVLLVAVGTPRMSGDESWPEPVRIDTAPAAADAPAQRVAALDSAVDWSRVEHAREEAGASVAAYER